MTEWGQEAVRADDQGVAAAEVRPGYLIAPWARAGTAVDSRGSRHRISNSSVGGLGLSTKCAARLHSTGRPVENAFIEWAIERRVFERAPVRLSRRGSSHHRMGAWTRISAARTLARPPDAERVCWTTSGDPDGHRTR
jgi:hypothetical protein